MRARNDNDDKVKVDYCTNQLSAFKSSRTSEVLYCIDNVINAELQFFSKAKSRIDTCMDYTPAPLGIGIEIIKKAVAGEEKRRRITTRAATLHFRLLIIDESLNQSLKTKEDTDKQWGI
jgi:hypothetical protein